jgi:hypothetical protein
MTKKLVFLALVLAAAVVASVPRPAQALTCGRGFHVVVCGDIEFCCRNGVTCDC